MEALTNSCPILLSGQETSLRRYGQTDGQTGMARSTRLVRLIKNFWPSSRI